MVSKLLPILFILPIVYAKIAIDISATDEKERDVRISGRYVNLINDHERETFDLTDENLKKSIATYFGLAPDNVYLRNPTPWGGLFKSLNWEPVKRVFLPTKAAILNVETKPELIETKNLVNEDSEPKIVNEKINHLVEASVATKWEKKPELEGEEIYYHLDIKWAGKTEKTEKTKKDDNSMYFRFAEKLGEDEVKAMPINVVSDLKITLKPKQNAKLEVLATKEIMKIRVDYETSLVGAVAVNYDKEYKGHRFWAMDIGAVQEAAGLKRQVTSWAVIDVVHYRDATVRVTDSETGDVIYTAALKMY